MNYLHTPGDEERLLDAGQYSIDNNGAIRTEKWERYERPDHFTVWHFEQRDTGQARSFRRLGHLLVNAANIPERLQIHQRGSAGLQHQTYTFFDDSVIVADNRVAGRSMIRLPENWTLRTPFLAAAVLAFPFPPNHEEGGTRAVYAIDESSEELLTGRLTMITFEPLGSRITPRGGTPDQGEGHGWRLRREDHAEEILSLTESGLTVWWERGDVRATLTRIVGI